MRRITTYAGVILAALVLAGQASAAAARIEPHCGAQRAKVELACATRALHRDAGTVRWVRHHAGHVLLSASPSLPHSLGFYIWRVKVDRHWIAEAHHRLRPHPTYSGPAGFPPHHALWMCIHGVEGPWNDTSAPYAGGLQMSIGWMNMVQDAGYLSEAQQEWIAERAYRANHYSVSFLVGQWFRWDGAYYCEKYA